MSDTPSPAWLSDEQGKRHLVGPRGLLVGRSLGSNVLLTDATASRRSAFVYTDLEGLWIVKVGRSSVRINHIELQETQRLTAGDVIHFPGASFVVHTEDGGRTSANWALRRETAPRSALTVPVVQALGDAVFSIGGGPDDQLKVPGWPPAQVVLEPRPPKGWLARVQKGVIIEGVTAPEPMPRMLTGGERIGYGELLFRLIEVEATQRDTLQQLPIELPTQVLIQPFVPSGGSITLLFGATEVTTWVPGVRFDLLQALLGPPDPYSPGDALPDGVLMPLVWGRQLPSDRKAVTTVLKRLRRDLDKAGLPGSLLVKRSQGRSSFGLAPGASVELLDPR